jgi:hypothetical protein
MNRPPRQGQRSRLQPVSATVPELLTQIRHWLKALEEVRNLRKNASRLPFTKTHCDGGGSSNHLWHVTLVPRPPHRTTRLVCAVPLIHFPPNVLMKLIVAPLRTEGFEVTEPVKLRCGCATFTVNPRRLAEG